MFNFVQLLSKSRRFNVALAYLHRFLPIFLLLLVFFFSYFLLKSPINERQYTKVQQIAEQMKYPRTELMATFLLKQQQVTKQEYLRLLHAYHIEKNNVKSYPAMQISPAK